MCLYISIICVVLMEISEKHTNTIEILTSCVQQQIVINDTTRLAIADLAEEIRQLKHK